MHAHHAHEHEHGPGHGRHGHGHGPGTWGPGRHGMPCFEGDPRAALRAAFGPFGPGGFGPGAGRGGPGGPWGGRGGPGSHGRARRGDVRASILALLTDRPMHGYEMIQEIAERSSGAWRPSPGSVYPTLQLLEDEGLISSSTEGGKKLYALTDAGREAAAEGPEAPWQDAGRGIDWEALSEIRQAGFGLLEAFGQVWKTGSKDQRDKALAVVDDARKKLYLILAGED